MATTIDDVAGLEACIGRTPAAIHLKVIDHLDDGAQRWIAASPFFFAAFGDAHAVGITPGGGAPGLARSDGPHQLCMPATALDEPQLAAAGRGFGALFLVPGLGEMLRVNGRVVSVEDGVVRVAVEECYVHCAKGADPLGFLERRAARRSAGRCRPLPHGEPLSGAGHDR